MGLAEQCLQAYAQARRLTLPARYRQAKRVLVAGMGGSAIGGDLLQDMAHFQGATRAVFTWRDYGLPAWVDAETLVIASSYSGDTEETLSAFDAALKRGAPVVALTSGGELKRRAQAKGLPTIDITYKGEPRTSLGYSFLAPLALLADLGFLHCTEAEVEQAVCLLEGLASRYGEVVPEETNEAKALARKLWGKVPIVYSAGLLTGVARRWKTDFNENAKTWAFAEALPELDHNAVNAYARPVVARESAFVLLLRSSFLSPRLLLRYEATAAILKREGVAHEAVDAPGDGPLAHILGMVYLGSWASYYLALLCGVDPSPVPAIAYLKERLAQGA